jgi:hypothetical protein
MDKMLQEVEASNIPDPSSHVQGIILSGEASTASMQEIKQVIARALPKFEDRFRFSINPHLVGAAGAAHRARQFVTEHAISNPRQPSLHEDL